MKVLILTEKQIKDLQNVVYAAMQQADQNPRTKELADRLEVIYEYLRDDSPMSIDQLKVLANTLSEGLSK